MNLGPSWVNRLRISGHEAQHWSEIGAPDASDLEILTWAAEHEAVVLTCDLDFGAILATSQSFTPSVVQIRSQDVLSETMGDRVLDILDTFALDLDQGAIVSIDIDLARLRILPLDDRGSS